MGTEWACTLHPTPHIPTSTCRVLTANHGKRIAVIQNEFGEDLGLGSTVAAEGKGGEVFEECYEMNNGCICCSVRDELVNTLERIMTKRHKFDYVLVETTGMANPGPLASIFWLDDELGSDLFLDAIITLVDAKHLLQHLDDPSPGIAALFSPSPSAQQLTKSSVKYTDHVF
jgi:G3E family GTPase